MPSAPAPTQPAKRLSILFAAALATGACRREVARPPAGDILADLALPTVSGGTFDPEPWYQRDVLVLFFSPTCGHCLKEMPQAIAAANQTGGAVLGVMVSGSREQAVQIAAVENLSSPVIVDDGRLRAKYGIRAVPYTLVLGAGGLAKRAFVGAQGQEQLVDALRDLHN
jgi:thiol-disulfide isomerase/thioredoxin